MYFGTKQIIIIINNADLFPVVNVQICFRLGTEFICNKHLSQNSVEYEKHFFLQKHFRINKSFFFSCLTQIMKRKYLKKTEMNSCSLIPISKYIITLFVTLS